TDRAIHAGPSNPLMQLVPGSAVLSPGTTASTCTARSATSRRILAMRAATRVSSLRVIGSTVQPTHEHHDAGPAKLVTGHRSDRSHLTQPTWNRPFRTDRAISATTFLKQPDTDRGGAFVWGSLFANESAQEESVTLLSQARDC